jgi:hypothetical protein
MAEDNLSLLNANLDNSLRPLFANKYFVGSIALFFALYAGWLAPKLPNSVIYFFDTIPGKLLFIFIIAFVASRNVENSFQVALVVSVMFLVTLTVLNKVKMQEAFQNLSMEHFNLMGTMQNLIQGQENYTDSQKECQDDTECNNGEKCSMGKCEQVAPTQEYFTSGPPGGNEGQQQQQQQHQGGSQEMGQQSQNNVGGLDQPCKSDNTCNDEKLMCNNDNPRKCVNKPAENFEAFSNYSKYSDF